MIPSLRFGLSVCLAMMSGSPARAASPDERIRPYEKNPYYWQYKGKPVLLLGGSVDDNLFQIPNLIAQLDLLKSVGGNVVRNTMSGRDPGNVQPFAKTPDRPNRKNLYDIERFNPEYWQRFETFLSETAKRDIIVQIEVWATFDYYRKEWVANAFNPQRNVNYTPKQSRLRNVVNSHPGQARNGFFFSAPEAKNLALVRTYQEKFVAKILDHTLKYDHVLYCMNNETAVTPTWGIYWANFIRNTAAKRGKMVETTDMWDNWNVTTSTHKTVAGHPETFTFLDISQNNHQKGQKHYDNARIVRRSIESRPRPINNTKIYGADTSPFGNSRDGVERFWRNIFGGLASARFHRPQAGLGLSPRAQQMLRSARKLTAEFDIFTCRSRNDLLADRVANEAYCLADPPRVYVVYFPASGEVTLDTNTDPTTRTLRWLNIDTGKWQADSSVDTVKIRMKTPGKGQWAALIVPRM